MECKPLKNESKGKEGGGLTHTTGQPQPSNKNNMKEDSRQVADLETANTTICTKEVLTSDEAAKYLGISKSYLYKLTMTRQIPHYKSPTGKLCFFNRREIEAWMQRCKVSTQDEIEQQAQAYCMKKGGKR